MESRAVILAAGRGSRMKEHTEMKPKCLTELDGTPLLDWQIASLRRAGLKDIHVVRGYKQQLIDRPDLKYTENEKWAETNMVSSLFCLENSADKSTIISYSDIVYHYSHISKIMLSESDITITADCDWLALWKLRFDNPFDDAETFVTKKGKLSAIGGKTQDVQNIEAQYMGLLKLSPKGWNIVYDIYKKLDQERQDKIDMTSMLNLLLEKGIPVNVIYINGKWCEVDSYSDVLCYEKEIQENPKWDHDWR